MDSEDEPESWQRRGLAMIGAGVAIAAAVGVGLTTFFSAMSVPLHPNPADVPSVSLSAPSPEWAGAVEQARQRARAALVEHNLPGLSVAAGVNGELVWAEGFGWADLEQRVPVTPRIRFRIGHVSKTLTSAAAGLLLEQGTLDLDEDIRTYVPAYPRKQWTVTLRQLMGHTAGIRHYESEADSMPTAHCERAADGVKSFADDPLRFQPDTASAYSTFGWILVSAAVEARANEPFFAFMRRRIFQPLRMRDTTTDSVTTSIPELATFYSPRLSGDTAFGPELAAPVDYSCFAGGGGFLSTPSDMVRFGMALASGTLLKPATVSVLHQPQRLLSGEKTQNGLGWSLETFSLAGRPTLAATDASRTVLGSSTSFMTFPERGVVVAVMSNTSSASLWPIALNVAQAFAASP